MKKFEIRGIAMIDGKWKDVRACDTIFNSRAAANKSLKNDTVIWNYDSVMNPYVVEI